MAHSNPNPANSGSGGQNRNKPYTPPQPKNEMVVNHEVIIDPAKSTYDLFIEALIFSNRLPVEGKEVILKEGITDIDIKPTDDKGRALLVTDGKQEKTEKIRNFRVCLSGVQLERSIVVKIPALPQAPVTPKPAPKKIVVRSSAPIISGNDCELIFEVSVLDSADKPIPQQEVTFKRGLTQILKGQTTNSGTITFHCSERLVDVEKNVTFRFSLAPSPEEEEVNVTVPAAVPKPKADNDPERLILRRYHDGRGHVRVMIRVIKAKGIGMQTPVTVWYRGQMHTINTDSQGEVAFSIPRLVRPGDHDHLVATVSGIADEASIDIKRHRLADKEKSFSKDWWLKTNNGRAFILVMLLILTWTITAMIGTGEAKINHRMFNDESGLSKAEQFYNRNAARVDEEFVIKPAEPWSTGRIAYWGTLVVVTGLILAYAIFSFREEIRAGIEDVFEKLFDKSFSKAGDPQFEKLAKIVGSYQVARRSPSVTTTTGSEPTPQPVHNSHPTLGTLFKLDLLSDASVAILAGILKKIF